MPRVPFYRLIDKDVELLLKKMADQDNRSVTNFLETLVRQEAAARGVKINGKTNGKPKNRQVTQ